MANRTWILPDDVINYTDYDGVKERNIDKLAIDIARAEQTIISYTNNDFSDPIPYPKIPDPVKIAAMLLAEAFAYKSSLGDKGNLKSETFDDYSYTMAEGHVSIKILDLGPLLEGFAIPQPKNSISMRVGKL